MWLAAPINQGLGIHGRCACTRWGKLTRRSQILGSANPGNWNARHCLVIILSPVQRIVRRMRWRSGPTLTRAHNISACSDLLAKEGVAVKKIPRPFQSTIEAKRTIREVKLLRSLSHDNVCCDHRGGSSCSAEKCLRLLQMRLIEVAPLDHLPARHFRLAAGRHVRGPPAMTDA